MIIEKKKKYASFTEFCALNREKKPTSKFYFSETNDPIFKKKSLRGNFVLLYNISEFQPNRIMGSALNPSLHQGGRKFYTSGAQTFFDAIGPGKK